MPENDHDHDDPRLWLFRRSVLDPIRKPLAVCMICGAVIVHGGEGLKRVFAGERVGHDAPTVDLTAPVPPSFSPEVPSTGGTAVLPGYTRAPPYDRVDPDPPDPLVFHVWIKPHDMT